MYLSDRPLVELGDGRQQDYLTVGLCRDNGQRSPRVHVVDETNSVAIETPLAEARALAVRILEVCDIAEAADAGPLSERLARATL